MAILPPGSILEIAGNSVFVSEISHIPTSIFFDRLEFSNERLKNAENEDGSVPSYGYLNGGIPFQSITDCNPMDARNLSPDDDNINDIKKKMVIDRYVIKLDGGPNASLAANVEAISTLAAQHKVLYDRFATHFALLQMRISYQKLLDLQSETFSYLTSGGISITGAAIGSVSNYFIRELTETVELQMDTPSVVLKSLLLTLDNNTIGNATA